MNTDLVKKLIQQRLPASTALDPQALAGALDEFERGYFGRAPQIFRKLRDRNYAVATVAKKREKALGRMPWTVLACAGADPVKAERHQRALSGFYNNVEATSVLEGDLSGGFRLLAQQILEAQAMKYAVHEITWIPATQKKEFSARFTLWPLECFEAQTGELRWHPSPGTPSTALEPGTWLVSVGEGLLRATVALVCLQQLGLQDWATFSEKFGLPFLVGKTSAPQGSAEWKALAEVIRNFVSDGGAVMNTEALVQLVEASGASGAGPQPGLVEFCDRWIATLWRGADLGTMSAGAGAGQGASLQGAETNLIEEDDAGFVTEVLNQKVDRMVIRYVFGEGVEPLARVKISPPKRVDVVRELAVDQFLVGAGVPMGVKDARERYQRPAPFAGQRVLGARG